MIAIVDTGGANLSSVTYALARAGKESQITSSPKAIERASHVILPGVGAAKDAMERIRSHEIFTCLRDLKQPVLGICLGMQLLFERSEEGETECLGILPGTVRKLSPGAGLTVPHMGWNEVTEIRENPLAPGNGLYYFVHSYVAPGGAHVLGTFDHGGSFPAIVGRDNFFGVQFHPERSAEAGATLLNHFLSL